MLLLVLLVNLKSAACLAFDVPPKLTKSSISDLLQQPTVTAIYRDAEGILWIGTQQGIYRHNGASITSFNTDKANKQWIPQSEIKDIAGDDKGNIFVATDSGIVLSWDRHLQQFSVVNKLAPSLYTRTIRMAVSKNGYVWLLHQKGLRLYDPEAGIEPEWTANIDIISTIGSPQTLTSEKGGAVWIGGSKGIIRVDVEKKSHIVFDKDKFGFHQNSSITAIEATPENKLIIGTNSGQLLVWDLRVDSALSEMSLENKGQIFISRLVLSNDKLVIGTDSGLYVSDSKLSFIEEVHADGDGATTTDVYSLLSDGQYIWVGKINGLDILTYAPFELFNFENSGVSNHAIAFAQDNRDRIWVGTYSGLFVYNEESRSHSRLYLSIDSDPTTPDDQRVVSLTDHHDELWVGLFDGGAIRFNPLTKLSQTPTKSEPHQMAVTSIKVSDNKEDVWVATYNYGLFRFDSEGSHSYLNDQRLPEESVNSLFKTNSGMLLAVAGNRLYQYELETDDFIELPIDYGLRNSKPLIYSIAESKTQDLLIGTKDYGLFIWLRKDQIDKTYSLKPAPPESSLGASTIYAMEVDESGNLWCSTQNGVVKLSPHGKLIKRFTTADGLQGNDFTLGASFKSREGLIYFGGTNGYNRFDPNDVEIDSNPSPMRLTGISLPSLDKRDLGEVADLKSLELTHKDRSVTFQFSVLDFIDPRRNQFMYMLENFDPEWIDNGNGHTATYTNLPAGDYVFRAQGANSAGIWNRDGIALEVKVLPAPWLTWWAYTLYGLLSICLMWGIHRIYRSYIIDRNAALQAQEMFEAENMADDQLQEQLEIQDELVRSAYRHNLTTLGLVSDSIKLRSATQPETVERDIAANTLERISALFGLEDCLSYQPGGPVVNLFKYTEGILSDLLERSPVSTENIVTINEVTALPVPAEIGSPISIVIFELLENCIQHAFAPDSPANYIHIKLIPGSTLEPAVRCYELTVHDSGIGMPNGIDLLALEGRGMAVVQFIAQQLYAQLEILEGSGTTIRLTVPAAEFL
jgi:ligand-binding sensor domain-containing protein/two-component sensor histidine kinase